MSRKRVFEKDLPAMMYGFGDVSPEEQDPDTVAVVDELTCEFLRFVAKEAASVSDGVKISLDDVMFVVRKDKKKHDRVRELVTKYKEIEMQKKIFKQQTNLF